jgi:hypothetical protein
MIPAFLLPEHVTREDGQGTAVSLGSAQGKLLLLTLGITRIIEQESLDVSIMGSADGDTWEVISTFPQKFYCGTYSMPVDLSRHPGIQHVRARWKMGRWGRGEQKPLFGFYLFAQEAARKVAGAA